MPGYPNGLNESVFGGHPESGGAKVVSAKSEMYILILSLRFPTAVNSDQ
jgi:hypothetical protein